MFLYFYDPHTHEFKESREAQLDVRGRPITDVLFATSEKPEAAPDGHVMVWNGSAWEAVEDHRQHVNKQGVKEGGTEYWLPEDNWLSPARYMEDLGPLPDGAVTASPEQPAEEKLADAKRAKTAQFDRVMADIDASLVRPIADIVDAMLNPETVSEGDTNTNFEQSTTVFNQLRELQAHNRVLRAQIESAQTVEEVQAIEPVTPHTAASRSAESVRRYYLV